MYFLLLLCAPESRCKCWILLLSDAKATVTTFYCLSLKHPLQCKQRISVTFFYCMMPIKIVEAGGGAQNH